ncbi:MAG TPA: MaoC/PaaZ C-terminal domain-containing protein [Solirubrobacteraceae bacterium]|nr:MaoC/PaaZ C-terminal domain-containing protein [Solirubrobacteraceae bacterium]
MSNERELTGSPSMTTLFARAGVAAIPGAGKLPFFSGGGGDVPDVALILDDVQIDPERLAAFDRVCGYSLSDDVPAAYIHVLAFPLQLKLMTDGSFPLPAIGLVHIANKFTQHRPVGIGERVSLRVWATELEPHPRGTQFTLRSQARIGDELVWEEWSTNLRRGGGGNGKQGKAPDVASTEDLPAAATWKLPGDLGRQYAAVSGDRNPIHMHALSAKLFGFPTAIAHGMWTKARCLAALGPRLDEKFTAEVAFRKPILLPATVKFAEELGDGAIRFGVRDARKGTPHLDGLVGLS